MNLVKTLIRIHFIYVSYTKLHLITVESAFDHTFKCVLKGM